MIPAVCPREGPAMQQHCSQTRLNEPSECYESVISSTRRLENGDRAGSICTWLEVDVRVDEATVLYQPCLEGRNCVRRMMAIHPLGLQTRWETGTSCKPSMTRKLVLGATCRRSKINLLSAGRLRPFIPFFHLHPTYYLSCL